MMIYVKVTLCRCSDQPFIALKPAIFVSKLSNLNNSNLPKIIWILWLQGLDKAPIEVKKCYESWVRHHPDWEVVFLDENDIAKYITLPGRQVAKYVVSEILRINLLAKYGGVWVDATCYCMKPLDEWLPEYMDAGFFAFERPGPDRMLSSWFLASAKYNYITNAWQNRVNTFWKENPALRLIKDTRWNFIYKKLKNANPQIWFNSLFTKILKVHPYFWFHYSFEYIYLRDASFSEAWDSVPKFSADIPHSLQFAGLFTPVTEEIKQEIAQKKSPIYKLTWKYKPEELQPGTVMDYLLNSSH